MSLISLLVALIVVCLVIWVARTILTAFAVPEPIGTLFYVVIVILVVLWLVGALGGVNLGRIRL